MFLISVFRKLKKKLSLKTLQILLILIDHTPDRAICDYVVKEISTKERRMGRKDNERSRFRLIKDQTM